MKHFLIVIALLFATLGTSAQTENAKWFDKIAWDYPVDTIDIMLNATDTAHVTCFFKFNPDCGACNGEFHMQYRSKSKNVLTKMLVAFNKVAFPQPSRVAGLTGFEGTDVTDKLIMYFERNYDDPTLYEGYISVEPFVPNLGAGKCVVRAVSGSETIE